MSNYFLGLAMCFFSFIVVVVMSKPTITETLATMFAEHQPTRVVVHDGAGRKYIRETWLSDDGVLNIELGGMSAPEKYDSEDYGECVLYYDTEEADDPLDGSTWREVTVFYIEVDGDFYHMSEYVQFNREHSDDVGTWLKLEEGLEQQINDNLREER